MGVVGVARPLDPGPARASRSSSRCSRRAGPSIQAFQPSKAPSAVAPLDQRLAVFFAEIHAPGIIQKHIEVAPRVARWLDGLIGQMDRPIRIGETSGLLAPDRGRQNDIRKLRPFRSGMHPGRRRRDPSCSMIRRIRLSSGRDTAGLVAKIQRNRIEPCSRAGTSASRGSAATRWDASRTRHSRAWPIAATCSGFFQLRNARRSPLTPHRGCSGRSVGRSSGRCRSRASRSGREMRWTLLTWSALAVAWRDW